MPACRQRRSRSPGTPTAVFDRVGPPRRRVCHDRWRARTRGPGRNPRRTDGRCPATRRHPVRGRKLMPGGRPYAVVRRTRRRAGAVRGAAVPAAGGRRRGWRHLRLLRQILDELVAGLEQFLLVDDVVAVGRWRGSCVRSGAWQPARGRWRGSGCARRCGGSREGSGSAPRPPRYNRKLGMRL